jgi:hypothetical protein
MCQFRKILSGVFRCGGNNTVTHTDSNSRLLDSTCINGSSHAAAWMQTMILLHVVNRQTIANEGVCRQGLTSNDWCQSENGDAGNFKLDFWL